MSEDTKILQIEPYTIESDSYTGLLREWYEYALEGFDFIERKKLEAEEEEEARVNSIIQHCLTGK